MTNDPPHTAPLAGTSTSQGVRLPPTGPNRRPYIVELTLLPRENTRSRSRFGRLWTMALKGMKKAAKKMFGQSSKPPPVVPIEDYEGDALADAPMLKSSDMPSLRLRLESITSALWRGQAATLVLVNIRYALPPPIPRIEVFLRIKPLDHNTPHGPRVVAGAPGKSKIETQPVEKTGSKEGQATAGGGGAGAQAEVKGTAKKEVKRFDYACGNVHAEKLEPHESEYDGIHFGMTAPTDSEHGLPTHMRLGLIYKYKGTVELEAKIGLKDNWRRFTRKKATEKHLTWEDGTNANGQSWPCSECNARASKCWEFTHASPEYWYSLLNQVDLAHWVDLPFDPKDPNAWLSTFDKPLLDPKTQIGR